MLKQGVECELLVLEGLHWAYLLKTFHFFFLFNLILFTFRKFLILFARLGGIHGLPFIFLSLLLLGDLVQYLVHGAEHVQRCLIRISTAHKGVFGQIVVNHEPLIEPLLLPLLHVYFCHFILPFLGNVWLHFLYFRREMLFGGERANFLDEAFSLATAQMSVHLLFNLVCVTFDDVFWRLV